MNFSNSAHSAFFFSLLLFTLAYPVICPDAGYYQMGNSISSFDPQPQLLDYDGHKYSRVIGDAEPALGFGPINHSTISDDFCKGFPTHDEEDPITNSAYELFELGVKVGGADSQFMGTRVWKADENSKTGYVERKDGSVDRFEYAWVSYAEAKQAIHAFGRGLFSLGVNTGDRVGIFSANRPEWTIAQYAMYANSLVCVPLYATLGPEAIQYIVGHSEIPVVVVSPDNLKNLVKVLPQLKETPLKTVILMDCLFNGRFGNTKDVVTEEMIAQFTAAGMSIVGMSEVIAKGQSDEFKDRPINPSKGDTIAFMMYTSGTTSAPKGVAISNDNITVTSGAVVAQVCEIFKPHNVYFSFLPLAHIFEVVVNSLLIAIGARIAYSQGDVRQIVSDLTQSKPTLLAGVPRIWTKFYQGAWSQIDQMSFIKRWYIYRAYNYQLNQLRNGLPLDPSYDAKVFKLLREKLGLDEVKIIITGAAPCASYLVEFMRVLTNGWFSQGFGMTETTAGTSISARNDYTIGSCGGPLAHCDFRLASVPDMGYEYTQENPTGELLLSGPSIFNGYYKNEEATREAFVEDSTGRKWFRTGDICRINAKSGSISIIDRKKALLKLAQGEYVSLEKCEGVYGKSPFVGQFWAYGNSFKSMMTAVVVPNVLPFYDLCVSQGWWDASLGKPIPGQLTNEQIDLFKSILETHREAVTTWMKGSLTQFEKDLLGFEKVKSIWIDCNFNQLGVVWDDQNELLTPTMKLRRQPLTKHYVHQLQQMYAQLGEPAQDGESWW